MKFSSFRQVPVFPVSGTFCMFCPLTLNHHNWFWKTVYNFRWHAFWEIKILIFFINCKLNVKDFLEKYTTYLIYPVQISLFSGVKLLKTMRPLESMPYYSLYVVFPLPGNCAFYLPWHSNLVFCCRAMMQCFSKIDYLNYDFICN